MLYNRKDTIEEIKNTTETIDSSELDEVIHAVGIVEKVYLERDKENLNVIAIEKPLKYINIYEGTADLVAIIKKGSSYYPKDYHNSKIIIDWKSKDAAFYDLAKWKKQYSDSWQWRLYSFVEGADCFEYRGISRANGETQKITLKVRDTNKEDCLDYLGYTQEAIEAFNKFGEGPWPRHKPFGCHAYNRECPFYDSCKNDKIAEGLEGHIQLKPLHYSDMEVFYLCPERYRLLTKIQEKMYTKGLGDGVESSRYTRFGAALHRGIAHIYKLSYKL